MAIAVEALTAGTMTHQGVQNAPNVSKDQWTVIGLLIVLLLLEAVVHPTIYNKIKAIIGTFKQGTTINGKNSNNSNNSNNTEKTYTKF